MQEMYVQSEAFSKEIENIKKKKELNRNAGPEELNK